MVSGTSHTNIEGQPCTGKEDLVENTLRVGCQYRIVLRFMGTVEESLMTRQFRTRVRYLR